MCPIASSLDRISMRTALALVNVSCRDTIGGMKSDVIYDPVPLSVNGWLYECDTHSNCRDNRVVINFISISWIIGSFKLFLSYSERSWCLCTWSTMNWHSNTFTCITSILWRDSSSSFSPVIRFGTCKSCFTRSSMETRASIISTINECNDLWSALEVQKFKILVTISVALPPPLYLVVIFIHSCKNFSLFTFSCDFLSIVKDKIMNSCTNGLITIFLSWRMNDGIVELKSEINMNERPTICHHCCHYTHRTDYGGRQHETTSGQWNYPIQVLPHVWVFEFYHTYITQYTSNNILHY